MSPALSPCAGGGAVRIDSDDRDALVAGARNLVGRRELDAEGGGGLILRRLALVGLGDGRRLLVGKRRLGGLLGAGAQIGQLDLVARLERSRRGG